MKSVEQLGAEEGRERLIVPLDVADVEKAERLVGSLAGAVNFYKIGMELFYADGGPAFAQRLIADGVRVFIDLKLHDIGATVEKATAQIRRLGAHFLTVHGFPQTMAAARRAVAGSDLKLLAVTVMTSYNDVDLLEAGYARNVSDLVLMRARQAKEAGVDGLIVSPKETRLIREILGDSLTLVTPGVRPQGADQNDQKRVATPLEAIVGGADYLVVGRPILGAKDPREAAMTIAADIARGLNFRQKTALGPR